jgi:hypothetical protein
MFESRGDLCNGFPSGENSCGLVAGRPPSRRLAFPHAVPGQDRLAKWDALILSFGAQERGYNVECAGSFPVGKSTDQDPDFGQFLHSDTAVVCNDRWEILNRHSTRLDEMLIDI